MSIFNTAAKLQYNSTVGGLPWWAFLFVFVFLVFFTKLGVTYDDTKTGEKKKFTWGLSIAVSLIITVIFMIGNWIRGGMFKARTNLYKKQGITNAKGAALQTQQMANLRTQIGSLNRRRV